MLPESSQSSGSAGFGTLVEFVELPLGGIAIEVGHALAHHLAAAGGSEKLESRNVGATGKLLALAVHPENAEGERGVDGGLGLVAADAENRKGRLALAQESAGVHGAAGVFEVGAVAEDSSL